MCGRLNVSEDPLSRVFLALTGKRVVVEESYNLAPTEQVLVVRERRRDAAREPAAMRWWLTPYWSKEPATRYSMFNAKAESLATSRAFREPFRRRRCVVPASGFYEWARQGAARLPYYIRPASDDAVLLAGVWDRWRGGDTVLESFAIVTTEAHPELAFVHDRQPAMLGRDAASVWLAAASETEELMAVLTPALPEPLSVIPVSTYVNNTRNQGPRCIEPIGSAIAVGSP